MLKAYLEDAMANPGLGRPSTRQQSVCFSISKEESDSYLFIKYFQISQPMPILCQKASKQGLPF